MTYILAYFGYVKVPKEAIRICMLLEDDFKDLINLMTQIRPEFVDHLKVRYKAMKTLTNFLRSGKLLNGGS